MHDAPEKKEYNCQKPVHQRNLFKSFLRKKDFYKDKNGGRDKREIVFRHVRFCGTAKSRPRKFEFRPASDLEQIFFSSNGKERWCKAESAI